MIETKQIIHAAKRDARELDDMLVDGRESIITRNISEIQGRSRSTKYVGRKAGRSADVHITSATEFAVEWFGANAIEDPLKSQLVREFWSPLFDYAKQRPTLYAPADFWHIDEELNALMSRLRKSVVAFNKVEAKFYLVQMRQKIDEAIRSVDAMRPV